MKLCKATKNFFSIIAAGQKSHLLIRKLLIFKALFKGKRLSLAWAGYQDS